MQLCLDSADKCPVQASVEPLKAEMNRWWLWESITDLTFEGQLLLRTTPRPSIKVTKMCFTSMNVAPRGTSVINFAFAASSFNSRLPLLPLSLE